MNQHSTMLQVLPDPDPFQYQPVPIYFPAIAPVITAGLPGRTNGSDRERGSTGGVNDNESDVKASPSSCRAYSSTPLSLWGTPIDPQFNALIPTSVTPASTTTSINTMTTSPYLPPPLDPNLYASPENPHVYLPYGPYSFAYPIPFPAPLSIQSTPSQISHMISEGTPSSTAPTRQDSDPVPGARNSSDLGGAGGEPGWAFPQTIGGMGTTTFMENHMGTGEEMGLPGSSTGLTEQVGGQGRRKSPGSGSVDSLKEIKRGKKTKPIPSSPQRHHPLPGSTNKTPASLPTSIFDLPNPPQPFSFSDLGLTPPPLFHDFLPGEEDDDGDEEEDDLGSHDEAEEDDRELGNGHKKSGKKGDKRKGKRKEMNRVAAKRHREKNKERLKALEDRRTWLNKAVGEYEKSNKKLRDTLDRLQRENVMLRGTG